MIKFIYTIIFFCISIFNCSIIYAQAFVTGVTCSANSTWLINKNITEDDLQDYVPSFGGNLSVNLSYLMKEKFEIELGFGVGQYNQSYKVLYLNAPSLERESITQLGTYDIPLLVRINSRSKLYAEFGMQYSIINSAYFRISNINSNVSIANRDDVYAYFSEFNLASLLGFGLKANFTDSFYMLIGLRVFYSIKDLEGIDALGRSVEKKVYYKDYSSTNLAGGGVIIKLAYSFGNRVSSPLPQDSTQ